MTGARTILLVEDSPDEVALAQAAFRRVGADHRLLVAEGGEEAIERLLGSGTSAEPRPDLVLLDLKLPGVDGFEVLRRVRAHEHARLVPIVVLTSSVEERDVLASYRLGANSYVRKPTDFDEFLTVLERIVGYWVGINQPPAVDGRP